MDIRISEYQVAGHQGDRDSSEIVHAPNLKNKIGAGSALILSLRNFRENPKRFNVKKNHLRMQADTFNFLRRGKM